MIRIMSEIAYMVILIAIFRGLKIALGGEFLDNLYDFMLGPYIQLYDKHYSSNLPDWAMAFVVIIGLAVCVMMFRNWFKITRFVAAFIIALVIFDIGYAQLDPIAAPPIEIDWILFATIGLGWLFLSGALIERAFWLWLRSKIFGRAW